MIILLCLLISFNLLAQQQVSIVGQERDTRTQVTEHSDTFYELTGFLKIGADYCTATFISPKHLVTNAHCVSQSLEKGVVPIKTRGLLFMAGKLENDLNFNGYRIRKIELHPKYVDRSISPLVQQEYDVAILEIRGRSKVGFAKVAESPSPTCYGNCPLYLATYPRDKTLMTLWDQMITIENWATETGNYAIHSGTTTPGTSGAAIRERDESGEWRVLGVNQGGGLLGGAYGVLFREEIYSWIISIVGRYY